MSSGSATHILFVGYGIDDRRPEAVSKNTSFLIRMLREKGYKVSILNIGYSKGKDGEHFYTSMFEALLHKNEIVTQLQNSIVQNNVTHVHDVFVLPLASVLFLLPVKKALPHLRYIKEIHNAPGFSHVIHMETIIRLLANRKSQLISILASADQSFTRNFAISKNFHVPYFPAPIGIYPFVARSKHQKLRVCYLGHPLKKKGIGEFPRIFKALYERGLQSTCAFSFALSDIGDREGVTATLRTEAKACGVEISFEGKVKPHLFFRKNDVFILPLHDQFSATSTPNTILEAMEAGCVVITTDTPSVQNVLFHLKNGYLLPPNRPDQAVAFLEQLVNNDQKRLVVAQQARKWIEQNISVTIKNKMVKKIYEEK